MFLETLVSTYKFTRRYSPEDQNLLSIFTVGLQYNAIFGNLFICIILHVCSNFLDNHVRLPLYSVLKIALPKYIFVIIRRCKMCIEHAG
jgi:hypothetical protein